MARYTIWIVQPRNDPSAKCFIEVAAGLAASLRQLGHEVAFDPGRGPYVQNPLPAPDGSFRRLIVFNAGRLPDMPLPSDAIIYNAEQVQTEGEMGAMWQSSTYLGLMRRHQIWDYSELNASRLRTLGVDRVAICGVGYYEGLTNIEPAPVEDVDVLFIGSMNERRTKLLQDIARQKLNTRVLCGVYGEERDRWIARAKIVLNVHFYAQPIFEIFRVSHLLANKKCVVSEDGGQDPALEDIARQTTLLVPYEQIPAACAALIRDDKARLDQALRGKMTFSKVSQVDAVKAALAQS